MDGETTFRGDNRPNSSFQDQARMAPPDFLPLAPSGRCPRVPRCSPERDGTAAAEAATVRKTVHSRAPDTAGTPANGHCRSASGTPTRGFTHRPGESPEHAEDPRAIPRGRHVATRRDDTGPLLRRQNRHHWEPSGGRPILSAIAVDRCHRPTPPTHATDPGHRVRRCTHRFSGRCGPRRNRGPRQNSGPLRNRRWRGIQRCHPAVALHPKAPRFQARPESGTRAVFIPGLEERRPCSSSVSSGDGPAFRGCGSQAKHITACT